MFVPVEPARIREDTVTTPPRASLGTSPSAAGPGRSTMATTPRRVSLCLETPSPPPNAPLPPNPPRRLSLVSLNSGPPPTPPPNRPLPPLPTSTPRKRPASYGSHFTAVQMGQEASMAQFVGDIADSQLPETPTRAYSQRHPRSRTYANQMKRLSAPAAPVDPITLRTPTYIAQRNRHTNMFDILQDLDVPQPLDNIHEEEGARDGVVLPGPVALVDFAVPATEPVASGDRFSVMGSVSGDTSEEGKDGDEMYGFENLHLLIRELEGLPVPERAQIPLTSLPRPGSSTGKKEKKRMFPPFFPLFLVEILM
ncbi:hypothetical protein HYFRA_00001554 [Hymenoscyphus fraxineus]|uniref:Uncharacterized protein n=1 Tax=Hymenoscyphus fraxineus TaxID=746836 RepID=A0A9N9L447_9HELO|nr:hypothetical protein HYFRA_00001554 [Hymenoscyphus fraxineus]